MSWPRLHRRRPSPGNGRLSRPVPMPSTSRSARSGGGSLLLELEHDPDDAAPEVEVAERQIDCARILLLKRSEIPEVAANPDGGTEEPVDARADVHAEVGCGRRAEE